MVVGNLLLFDVELTRRGKGAGLSMSKCEMLWLRDRVGFPGFSWDVLQTTSRELSRDVQCRQEMERHKMLGCREACFG